MLSIIDYGLNFYIPLDAQAKYKAVVTSDLPLEEKVFELLTINPGFMQEVTTEEQTYVQLKRPSASNILKDKIKKNKKLEFFSLSFNTKPRIKDITNGLIAPDVSDFLTLLHLNLVFKHINDVYEPGASLRIGVQFNYFRKFAGITEKYADELFNMLLNFNQNAEILTGSKENILLFDVYREVESYKKEFFLKVEGEKFLILQEDQNMTRVREGANYYMDYVVDVNQFPNKEAAWNFCMYHTLDSAAYKTAIFDMFDTNSGLFERFSEMIIGETRFQTGSNFRDFSKTVYVAFLPGALTFSFNRLTLRTKNGLWDLEKYNELKKMFAKEVFVKELSHPFFFEEKPIG